MKELFKVTGFREEKGNSSLSLSNIFDVKERYLLQISWWDIVYVERVFKGVF